MLVVGSCTREKHIRDCPCLLTSAGLRHEDWRERLRQWELPAVELYTGPQHLSMMRGVASLRGHLGKGVCEVNIISAGYGLVTEQQPLVPYEVTFSGVGRREIIRLAEVLGIPSNLEVVVKHFPLVVFLLGKDYLYSTHPPLQPRSGQRFLYFASEDSSEIVATGGATVALAGKTEATRYGASTLSLKGRMFELLASGLARNPIRWTVLLEDDTPSTAIELMESGLESD